MLIQAYFGLSTLTDLVRQDSLAAAPIETFSKLKPLLTDGNDYAFFSTLSAERVNQSVVTNKQVMKIAIMQIGFAVISVGMMFIVLGIKDGGGSGAFEMSGWKFDFKTGSTGVLIFLIGSGMATAGGVLKNDYNTVPVPQYVQGGNQDATAQLNAYYSECKKRQAEQYEKCFTHA